MEKIYLFLAEGFEEMEAIAVVDVLRRGGLEVETVSVSGHREVKSSHGVVVTADRFFDEVKAEQAACLIFPGGMPGAKNLGECAALMDRMQKQYDEGRYVAAICAAPALVLGQLKTDRKLQLTCYPGFEKYLSDQFEVSTEGIVVDGKVISGKGPGYALKFGLTILEQLCSAETAKEVADGMLFMC